MKTRLLRKIRKRYQILKVEKVSKRNCAYNNLLQNHSDQLGLPFYVVIDKDNPFCGIDHCAYKVYKHCVNRLLSKVNSEYGSQFPKLKNNKTTKVWWRRDMKTIKRI